MMRLFIAVPLPEEVQERLEQIGYGIPGANWVAAENMHITLRFVGEVSNAVAADIDEALLGVRAPEFDFSIEGVGHFGSLRQARSVWAGIARNPALVHLRDKVESAVVRSGQPPETRKFLPHITLARLKSETGHHLANFLAEHSLLKIGPVRIDRFTLFQSFLKREGSFYEALAEYPLVDARAAALT